MEPVWKKFEGEIGEDLIDAALRRQQRQLTQTGPRHAGGAARLIALGRRARSRKG